MRRITQLVFWIVAALLCVSLAAAQGNFAPARKQFVTAAPIPAVTLTPGKPATVDLAFRVVDGYHINSNQPKGEALTIPTIVKFDPPTDVVISKISYPPGHDYAFDFAPDEKLSVYSGDFHVTAAVSAAKSIPKGTYRVRGTLKYQACDNRACYPPNTVPLEFDVNVQNTAKTTGSTRRNPGQSPHVHQ